MKARLAYAVLFLFTSFTLTQPAVAQVAPPTLAGEYLEAHPFPFGPNSTPSDLTITNRDCDTTGTGQSTFTFEASGPAVGPYPGTFTETGTFVIGPQSPIGQAPFFQGPIVSFHAEFAIVSGDATVSGTKDASLTQGYGRCADYDAANFVQLVDALVESSHWTTPFDYEATITSPDGVFRVEGDGGTNGGVDRGTGTSPTGGTETFTLGTLDQFFTTSTPVAPQCSNGVDDDNDNLIDFPADPGCQSATDDSESPNPPPPPPVAPSTKDDCRNGGWKNYPALGFKNQGDCVSYVNAHEKKPK